jgi:hypothetical protein
VQYPVYTYVTLGCALQNGKQRCVASRLWPLVSNRSSRVPSTPRKRRSPPPHAHARLAPLNCGVIVAAFQVSPTPTSHSQSHPILRSAAWLLTLPQVRNHSKLHSSLPQFSAHVVVVFSHLGPFQLSQLSLSWFREERWNWVLLAVG